MTVMATTAAAAEVAAIEACTVQRLSFVQNNRLVNERHYWLVVYNTSLQATGPGMPGRENDKVLWKTDSRADRSNRSHPRTRSPCSLARGPLPLGSAGVAVRAHLSCRVSGMSVGVFFIGYTSFVPWAGTLITA